MAQQSYYLNEQGLVALIEKITNMYELIYHDLLAIRHRLDLVNPEHIDAKLDAVQDSIDQLRQDVIDTFNDTLGTGDVNEMSDDHNI